jgi:hypothetical protein
MTELITAILICLFGFNLILFINSVIADQIDKRKKNL